MIVILELTEQTRATIAAHAAAADGFAARLAEALGAAAEAGAGDVQRQLMMHQLDLTMRHPGQGGLAGSVAGWMIDEAGPLAAIGVPSDSSAASYAAMLEFGGTILPVNAQALAVPVSEEAKLYTSPRDMPDLVLIKRPGKPAILARVLGEDTIEVHWVLLSSVTISGRHWLSRGVENAAGEIAATFADVLGPFVDEWSG